MKEKTAKKVARKSKPKFFVDRSEILEIDLSKIKRWNSKPRHQSNVKASTRAVAPMECIINGVMVWHY